MIRHASIRDSRDIQHLVNIFADKGEMLHLSLQQIYERIFEFVVFEHDGKIIGCCSLHPTQENLAEIRSLAVESSSHAKGIGRQLVQYCLDWAKNMGFKQVFALTYKPIFFGKIGFKEVKKESFPRKIWSDCLNCPKFPDCDEIGMIIDL
ncbi:MAG: N-acetyltransferase [Calditerrivibrio sp.]|nr:N-acetyltransferase [Calditerrivibrio sp.]